MFEPDAITLEGLTKFYGAVKGVERITLSVKTGECFGLLGPNGAGKTTCLRLLLGFLKPDGGTIRVFGRNMAEDSWRFKERVGNLPGEIEWWPDLTGREILDFFAAFRPGGPPPLQQGLLDRFELPHSVLARKVRTYSRGTKRKLGLVTAMQHDPDLLILDEPTSGLDPLLQRAFYDTLHSLKNRGKTVLLSSHNLFETQILCDRIGVIRAGDLVALETLESFREKNLRTVEVVFQDPAHGAAFDLAGMENSRCAGRQLHFQYDGPVESLLQALAAYPLDDLAITPPSLEDFFLQYYRDGAQEPGEGGGS